MKVFDRFTTDNLTLGDVKELRLNTNFTKVWYFYESQPYEGRGILIGTDGKLWGAYCLGHCSCYGPVDRIDWRGMTTVEELEERLKRGEGFDPSLAKAGLEILKEAVKL